LKLAFSAQGSFAGKVGSQGGGEGQLQSPMGACFNPGEDIFVMDTMNNRVQKFVRK
jgi:hypothetical protein